MRASTRCPKLRSLFGTSSHSVSSRLKHFTPRNDILIATSRTSISTVQGVGMSDLTHLRTNWLEQDLKIDGSRFSRSALCP